MNIEHTVDEGSVANVTVVNKPPKIVRLLWAVIALLVAMSLALTLVYIAPTLAKLVDDSSEEKARDACFDRHSSQITEASFGVSASIGALVVGIAVPPDQRDLPGIQTSIADIRSFTEAYRAAIDARKAYVASGRPLPCPIAD